MSMIRSIILALVVAMGMTMVGVWSADASDPAKPGADDPRYLEGVAAFENKDFEEAYTIWIELAEAGNAAAQFAMGRGYDTGEYLEKDWKEAIRWYMLAGDQGDLDAIFYHAKVLYAHAQNAEEFVDASKLYEHAAERDHLKSQINLGLMLVSGKTQPYELVRGLMWLYLAKENGWKESEEAFAYMRQFVKQDEFERGREGARRWRERHPR